MQRILIYSAASLAMVIALVHGYVSEFKLLPATRFEPERLRALMRGVWQLPTIDWIAFSLLLVMTPSFASRPALHAVVAVSAGVFACAAAVNYVGTRGRHFGWKLLALVSVLLLASLAIGAD